MQASNVFQLVDGQSKGIYPSSLGPVSQPIEMPPIPKTVNDQLPTRVPADPSKDSIFGEVTVPFFSVQDPGMSLAQQMGTNPYYRLRHTRYYSQTSIYQRPTGPYRSISLENTTGMTDTNSKSMTSTTSLTVMADGGINFDNVAGSISTTIEDSLVVEETTTAEVMSSTTTNNTFDFQDQEGGIIAYYALTHAFEIFRADNTSIGRWTMSNGSDLYEDSFMVPAPAPGS